MRGINLAIIVGTLGKDPEVKYSANGTAVARFSVATNEEWTDKNSGQKQTSTEWHNIVIWGKLAEIAGQYLKKGSQVYLQGKNKTRKWQDQQTGQDRYTTEIVLQGHDAVLQMLGSPNGANATVPFDDGMGMGQQPPINPVHNIRANMGKNNAMQGNHSAQQQMVANGYNPSMNQTPQAMAFAGGQSMGTPAMADFGSFDDDVPFVAAPESKMYV